MTKRLDAVALGETLIDLTAAPGQPSLYAPCPGGAPANMLAMLSRLGRKTAFLGKVGDDAFGRLLRQKMTEAGICTDALRADPLRPTTRAVVSTDEAGERSFSFYREEGADRFLSPEEVDVSLIRSARCFHFGSLSLTHETNRAATVFALEAARAAGCLVSFDPNLRPRLWRDLTQARRQIAWGMAHAHAVKLSLDEARFLLEDDSLTLAAAALVLRALYPGIRLLSVTDGANGSLCAFGDPPETVFTPAVLTQRTCNTTGAGDCFCACMVETLLRGEPFTAEAVRAAAGFAAAAAACVTTRPGALEIMPARETVESFLKEIAREKEEP